LVKIRLQRTGTKNDAHYRIVAADARSPRDGKFIELLGSYHPTMKTNQTAFYEDKIISWLGKGAQPTETVYQLLRKAGILNKFKETQKA